MKIVQFFESASINGGSHRFFSDQAKVLASGRQGHSRGTEGETGKRTEADRDETETETKKHREKEG